MDGKQQFSLALAAAAGGLAWGYIKHRNHPRVTAFALVQALEWFVAYGGASAVLASLRETMEQAADRTPIDAEFDVERVTRIRQSVTERTGTDG